MRSHKDLEVWREAVKLCKVVYGMTGTFPKEEMFGLTTQMRRAAVSVASNIAEGAARQGDRELVKFLYIAVGSVSELDTQIEIAREVGLSKAEETVYVQECTERVARLLQGLIRSVKARSIN